MENINGNFNYNLEFLKDLKSKTYSKTALLVNKKNSNRKYDFAPPVNSSDVLKLAGYNSILTELIYCNDCFEETSIEDVIQKIKNILK